MSFSNGFQGGNSNPCKHWIEHKGGEGFFQRWEKNPDGKGGTNKIVDLSQFIVLDDSLFTITGYSENLNAGFFSNEVRSIDQEEIVVRFSQGGKKHEFARGTYNQIKEKVKSSGGKYTASVYILIPAHAVGDTEGGDIWHLANVKFSGSSLNAWIEFRKEAVKGFCKHIVGVTAHKHKEKRGNPDAKNPEGKVITQWEEPVFEFVGDIDNGLQEIARDEDIALQEYLAAYLKSGGQREDIQSHPAYDETQEYREGVVEETRKEQPKQETVKQEQKREETRQESQESHPSDGWESYVPKSGRYPALGECTIAQLEEMKGLLENGYTGTQQYAFVIRGIAEKKKQGKSNPFGKSDSPI